FRAASLKRRGMHLTELLFSVENGDKLRRIAYGKKIEEVTCSVSLLADSAHQQTATISVQHIGRDQMRDRRSHFSAVNRRSFTPWTKYLQNVIARNTPTCLQHHRKDLLH